MQVVEILVGKFLETLMPDGLEKFIEFLAHNINMQLLEYPQKFDQTIRGTFSTYV